MSVTAKCMCGAVSMSVKSPGKNVGACHCDMCRRWGGAAFLAVDCGTEVGIDGQEAVGVYDSSQWAERGFCKTCGTHLFYRLKHNQQHMIPAGVLDGCEDLTMHLQFFIDKKPVYYTFADKTKTMTAAEVFEKLAPK